LYRRTDDEFAALGAECSDRPMLYLYVMILGESGGRCKSEGLWLEWDDVKPDDGFMQVVTGRNGHGTKGGKSRWVPMTPRLVMAMRARSLASGSRPTTASRHRGSFTTN
jgi:integrase